MKQDMTYEVLYHMTYEVLLVLFYLNSHAEVVPATSVTTVAGPGTELTPGMKLAQQTSNQVNVDFPVVLSHLLASAHLLKAIQTQVSK